MRPVQSFQALLTALLFAVSFDVSAQRSTYFLLIRGGAPVDFREFEGRLDELFAVVVDRAGVSFDEQISATFSRPDPGPCRSRGATMLRALLDSGGVLPRHWIEIRSDENTSMEQILGILAHELGHVLQNHAVDGGQSISSIFNEGFATWVAGPYWLAWHGASSFDAAVASYIAAGNYMPLHENDGFVDTLSEAAVSRFGEDCLNQRDIIYTEWAGLIEYLVEEFGRQQLYALFQTPPIEIGDGPLLYRRPDFAAVYGNSLEELEAAWLETISGDE